MFTLRVRISLELIPKRSGEGQTVAKSDGPTEFFVERLGFLGRTVRDNALYNSYTKVPDLGRVLLATPGKK